MASNCEFCENYCYDEENDEYYCNVNMDEDEYLNFLHASNESCPYFRRYDEYKIVEKQN